MNKKVEDYFCFEIWTYEGGGYCVEVGSDFSACDLSSASRCAELVSSTMREQSQGEPILLQLDLYRSGIARISWELDLPTPFSMKQVLWTKRALNTSLYENIYGVESPPAWLTNLLGKVEFYLTKLIRRFWAAPQQELPGTVRPTGQPAAQESPREPLEAVERALVPGTSNVVQLRPRKP